MKNKPVALNQLPQTDESWFACLRPLNVKLEGSDGLPTILILTSLTDEIVLHLDVYGASPPAEMLRETLLQAMRQPEQGDLTPRRPKEVQFEQADLLEQIAPALRSIQVAASQGEAPALVDVLITELTATLGAGQSELPGLLSVPGTDPKMIASLFEAAAGFYRRAPWKRIADVQSLAVTIDPPDQQVFVQVMGNGGMEFGLSLYTSWDDVLCMFQDADSPLEILPESGMHGLTFESKEDLPAADREALRKYGWKTAGRKAHPMPVIFTKDGQAERPPRQELLVYEALLRGLPAFIEQHLVEDGRGDFKPATAVIESRHADGPVRLTIEYPAGELPEMIDEDEFFLQEIEQLAEGKPILDLPASLQEANRLADQAWLEKDPQHKLELARQALEISPDCSEAYLALAYESQTSEESQDWLEKAVQAGERLLGQDFISTNQGELWYWREARPYLRACGGLAEILEEQGQFEEALAQYLALLELDEDDHQGARYEALRLQLLLKQDEQALDLLDLYEDDSTAWAYSRALLAFRQSGDVAHSRSLLKKAARSNRHVPAYLIGARPLPEQAPEAVGFGDESEAIEYALGHYALWWATPGAVDWLKKRKT